jgi:hypothetical protein
MCQCYDVQLNCQMCHNIVHTFGQTPCLAVPPSLLGGGGGQERLDAASVRGARWAGHSAVQCRAWQCSAVQYSAVQYSAVQCSAVAAPHQYCPKLQHPLYIRPPGLTSQLLARHAVIRKGMCSAVQCSAVHGVIRGSMCN